MWTRAAFFLLPVFLNLVPVGMMNKQRDLLLGRFLVARIKSTTIDYSDLEGMLK
jgi:hypothetical protein